VERCQGFASTSPPQESVPFSYTHRPGRSGSHGPAGSWVDSPIPQNTFVWVLLKIGSRASKSAFSHNEPRGEAGAGHRAAQDLGTTQYTKTAILLFVPRPAAALPAPFSYTHRPGRSGRHGPAGSWVDLPIPQHSFVCVLLKIGSRAPTHGDGAGGPPGPGKAPVGTRRPCSAALGAGRAPRAAYPTPRSQGTYPTPPDRPTLHLPYTARPAYPTPRSQPTNPIPPDRPTLHLPSGLPYTALPSRPPSTSQPTYPTPLQPTYPHLPTDLPYTSRSAYPAPPDRPTLHRPTDLPCTLTSRPTYPIPLLFPFPTIDAEWE
jgi:hypothetical protein